MIIHHEDLWLNNREALARCRLMKPFKLNESILVSLWC